MIPFRSAELWSQSENNLLEECKKKALSIKKDGAS